MTPLGTQEILLAVWLAMALVTFGATVWYAGVENIEDPFATILGMVFFWPLMLVAIIGATLREKMGRTTEAEELETLKAKLAQVEGHNALLQANNEAKAALLENYRAALQSVVFELGDMGHTNGRTMRALNRASEALREEPPYDGDD